MSGSYDNRARRGGPRHPDELPRHPGQPADYDEPARARPRPAPRGRDPNSLHLPPPGDDLAHAPPPQGPRGEMSKAAIVQAGSVTGRSLTLVVSIMCFLACLTAGAVYMINQSASAWLRNIASEITIQVEPKQTEAETVRLVKDVQTFVALQPGILNVQALSKAESGKLLEPWLGKTDVLSELPIPRLIALELDRAAPPRFDRLSAVLTKQFPGVVLDDHRNWQRQIRTVTRSFALGGLAILFLVGAATTAIIVSATRSAMASNREIVEVLHFVGATDRFIAHEFEKHFLTLGIRAGLIGAVAAMAVFFLMPSAMRVLGGGTVTLAELKRFVGTGVLDGTGYLMLVGVVIVIAALCMLTSRFGVYRILNSGN
jgi:cell division transport system permease protein